MKDQTATLIRASIGLFMALGTYLAARRRKTGWGQARLDYPALAERLGLTHKADGDTKRIGSLRGTFEGHDVFVDPDERSRMVVYLRGEPQVILRSYVVEKRTPPGWVRVETGESWLDSYFKDRYGTPAAARTLRDEGRELAVQVRRIVESHLRENVQLSITAERLECALDFGKPVHLPADTVERLLPDLVALAELVEDAAAAERSAEAPVEAAPP